VLADGGTVHLRPAAADDAAGALAFYRSLSERSRQLRFFAPVSPDVALRSSRFAETVATDPGDGSALTLVTLLDDGIVGIGSYERTLEPATAEVAFAVADAHQGRGIGSLLLEHLAAAAREAGIHRFVASTMPDNGEMRRVFADVGFTLEELRDAGDVLEVTFPIASTALAETMQWQREQHAEAASIARLLAPRAIAVVGAGRRPGTIGHELLGNLLRGGFTGPVFPVNAHARSVAGVRAYGSLDDVPDPVDLVVVCVPATDVPAVVEAAARKQAHGVVVISAGFAEVGDAQASTERSLVELARRHGMRLVGPNCMGILNTDPAIAMNATFAPFHPAVGRVGFSSQSGGLGIGLLAEAESLGLGLSTFVSLGNKADVSGNDLLQYWETDPATDLILLYLESFGNPRKFARVARRVSRTKPIVAVKSGRSPAGARGAASHTAALASPDRTVDALFHQAGVIRVDTLEQLFDTATLLAHQPLPPGDRVAIVSNGGGPAILAADACEAAGLAVPELPASTQAALREFVDPDAAVRNPVDLVASASAAVYERALQTLVTEPTVDAVIAIFVPPLVTEPSDVERAIETVAAEHHEKPIVSCFLGRRGVSRPGARVPSYPFPESAAGALARASRYAAWRQRPEGTVPVLPHIDIDAARAFVARHLAAEPSAEWLGWPDAAALLAYFGITLWGAEMVASADAAVEAAGRMGYPVALKAGAPALVHKTDRGGVELGLASGRQLRAAFSRMHGRLGADMGPGLVQPMAPTGVETLVGVTRDPNFGPLVVFGMGGVEAELLRDTALRIVPLTDVDATELVRSPRTSARLFGFRGSPAVDVAALEALVLRVAALADAVPEVAELDLNPVIVGPDGLAVVDAKLRLAPVPPGPPPGVRRMRDR
jgi:acetyl coenzyme A synthetase (ADP forming)-like protein